MAKRTMKYNPAFLTDQEIIESFAVRETDLTLLSEIIRHNTTQSNQHILIIGPRGSGKTMLALRAAAEVRTDAELNLRWHPVVFSEESYQVHSAGEFWLEALLHLERRTDSQDAESRWQKTYEELRGEKDERRLRERALAQVLDFADAQGKRLLLVVENLNMLLGSQMNDQEAWALRHTLMNEPRIMLLATATRRFDEVTSQGHAFFDLLRAIELKPLELDECRKLWIAITGQDMGEQRIRPIQILTGGSPRLISILASFAKGLSLRSLLEDLTRLVDDHTEYFKSHLESLAPTELKVYLALTEIWDPATARQVAEAARLDINKTSAMLQRLEARGAVMIVAMKGRKRWYQVAERLYNIYYLMRRHGGVSARVQALIRFIIAFYDPSELAAISRRIIQETCDGEVDGEQRYECLIALEKILANVPPEYRKQVLDEAPESFLKMPELPESVREWKENDGNRVVKVKLDIQVPGPKIELSSAVSGLSDSPKPIPMSEEELAVLLREANRLRADDRMDEAETLLKKALNSSPKGSSIWNEWGRFLLYAKRFTEAAGAFEEAVKIGGDRVASAAYLLWVYFELGKVEDALALLDSFVEDIGENPYRVVDFDYFLKFFYEHAPRFLLQEIEKRFRKAMEKDSQGLSSKSLLSAILAGQGKIEEALSFLQIALNSERFSIETDFLPTAIVELAAQHQSEGTLCLLKGSPHIQELEPLLIALDLCLGHEVRVASEVLEVAKDIVRRIDNIQARKRFDNTRRIINQPSPSPNRKRG